MRFYNVYKLFFAFLFIVSINGYTQQIVVEYKLERQFSKGRLFTRLVLNSNGSYFKKIINTGHLLESYEEKGNWEKKKDTLILNLEQFISFPEYDNSEWNNYERKDMYLVKKRSIIPVFNNKLTRRLRLKKTYTCQL